VFVARAVRLPGAKVKLLPSCLTLGVSFLLRSRMVSGGRRKWPPPSGSFLVFSLGFLSLVSYVRGCFSNFACPDLRVGRRIFWCGQRVFLSPPSMAFPRYPNFPPRSSTATHFPQDFPASLPFPPHPPFPRILSLGARNATVFLSGGDFFSRVLDFFSWFSEFQTVCPLDGHMSSEKVEASLPAWTVPPRSFLDSLSAMVFCVFFFLATSTQAPGAAQRFSFSGILSPPIE